ncbi:hypothetical protein KSP40_PGU013596 [Platanthera guangdongensis]|uniref:CCHC-type domain-containing protein n=1 Tax=Platanthera guangdongensis TaxID=2320717 RepID=A0ABR2M0V4_9ASPA
MSEDRSRSPPPARRFRGERNTYRDAPYSRDRSGYRQVVCKNCKRPGHFARDCSNIAVCNNCSLPGHIAAECTAKTVCWNCKESGHIANECSNDAGGPFRDIVCRMCNQPGHISRDCAAIVICNTCGGRGHMSYECPSGRMFDRLMFRRY